MSGFSGERVVIALVCLAMGGTAGWYLQSNQPIKCYGKPARPEVVKERVEVPVEVVREVKVPQVMPRVSKSAMQLYFEEWAATESLAGAALGFCVMDDTGTVVFASPLAETALCPASAFKTLTAGAAFGLLGEGFQFETSLLGGMSSSGVVTGDLVLKGGGDPTLSESDLVALADAAVKMGLKRVEGVLQVDDSVFRESPVSDHWVWGDLGNAYGAGAFGINVDHNVMLMSFDAGAEEGDAAKFLGAIPGMRKVAWDVKVNTGPAGSGDRVMIYSSPYGERIQARGTVPLGAKGFAVRGAVPDPPGLAGDILRVALEKKGVAFGGKKAMGLSDKVIAAHRSEALPEIIDHMQEVSDNLEAQCLFLTMGARAGKDATEVLKAYWEGMGVSFQGLRVIDGSGLARATMIRSVDLARVNFAARKAVYGERFLTSMPANRDGSMRSKRGAMSGVRTEVGFVNSGGKEYTFALMANGLANGVDFWKLREGLLEHIGK